MLSSGARLRKNAADGVWEVMRHARDGDEHDELGVDAGDGDGASDPLPAVDRSLRDPDPLWERPPASVRRYVLGTEKRLVCLRRHLIVLAEPVLSCFAGLVLVLCIVVQVEGLPALPNLLFLGWLFLLGRAVWRWLQWRADWFIATDRRLLLTFGVFKRQVSMMPLTKVIDMSYNRSLVGRVLGYGELVMESAGKDQAIGDIDRLPMPDQVYVRICEQLFGQVEAVDAPARAGVRIRRLAEKALPNRFR